MAATSLFPRTAAILPWTVEPYCGCPLALGNRWLLKPFKLCGQLLLPTSAESSTFSWFLGQCGYTLPGLLGVVIDHFAILLWGLGRPDCLWLRLGPSKSLMLGSKQTLTLALFRYTIDNNIVTTNSLLVFEFWVLPSGLCRSGMVQSSLLWCCSILHVCCRMSYKKKSVLGSHPYWSVVRVHPKDISVYRIISVYIW